MTKLYTWIFICIVLALFVTLAGWYLWRPAPPRPETYAPAERQADGSLVLERKPTPDAKQPKNQIPEGGKVERIIQIEVKSALPETPKPGASADCPPVQVDMAVVKMPDESRRVVASSSNGQVIGGVDTPVELIHPVDTLKWAAGLTANPIGRTYGIFIDRDIGPFRLGAEFNQIKGGYETRLKAGVRF